LKLQFLKFKYQVSNSNIFINKLDYYFWKTKFSELKDCNQKGRESRVVDETQQQATLSSLSRSDRASIMQSHTTRTQHNKRLFLISNRDFMTQLQSYSSELSQSLLLLTQLRLREIEWQNSIAYISQKEPPTAQVFLLLPKILSFIAFVLNLHSSLSYSKARGP